MKHIVQVHGLHQSVKYYVINTMAKGNVAFGAEMQTIIYTKYMPQCIIGTASYLRISLSLSSFSIFVPAGKFRRHFPDFRYKQLHNPIPTDSHHGCYRYLNFVTFDRAVAYISVAVGNQTEYDPIVKNAANRIHLNQSYAFPQTCTKY